MASECQRLVKAAASGAPVPRGARCRPADCAHETDEACPPSAEEEEETFEKKERKNKKKRLAFLLIAHQVKSVPLNVIEGSSHTE